AAYLDRGERSPLSDWLVFEVLGVVVGGFISGRFAGRTGKTIEKGPRITPVGRLLLAFTGGTLIGFAAKLARGCTSGQALTGGALLSVGGWIFMIALFIGAYAFAYFVRRQWT
ncbi:MAG: YeeE/YedE thiosulfate transporter family protein, partial [Bacteroidota bacterium]